MTAVIAIIRRVLRWIILLALRLRGTARAAIALGAWLRHAALVLVVTVVTIGLHRTLFDPDSEGYRAAHPAVAGSWTGVLAADVPAMPRRDPYSSEAGYRLEVRQWEVARDDAAADTRGIHVDLHSSFFGRAAEVSMCAPNGAVAHFTTNVETLGDRHLTAVLDLPMGPHDPTSREMGNLDLSLPDGPPGHTARASYEVFGSTIGGVLVRGGEPAFASACAQVRRRAPAGRTGV